MKKQILFLLIISILIGVYGCKKESEKISPVISKDKNLVSDPVSINPIDTMQYYCCDPTSILCRWRIDKSSCGESYLGFPRGKTYYPSGFIQFYPDSTFLCVVNSQVLCVTQYGANFDTTFFSLSDTIYTGRIYTEEHCYNGITYKNLTTDKFFGWEGYLQTTTTPDSINLTFYDMWSDGSCSCGIAYKTNNNDENMGGCDGFKSCDFTRITEK